MKYIFIFIFFTCLSCTIGDGGSCGQYDALEGFWSEGSPEEFAFEFIGKESGLFIEHEGGADTCTYEISNCETGAIAIRCDNFSDAAIIFVLSDNVLSIDGDQYIREIEPCQKFEILDGSWSRDSKINTFKVENSQGAEGTGIVIQEDGTFRQECSYILDCFRGDMFITCPQADQILIRIRILSDNQIAINNWTWDRI